MLFLHNYSTTNVLEKLTSVDQLKEGSVIEVVVSGKSGNEFFIIGFLKIVLTYIITQY